MDIRALLPYRIPCFINLAIALAVFSAFCPSPSQGDEPHQSESERDRVSVTLIQPDPRGGKAYQLSYFVKVPLSVYWKFKTDFNNDFLVQNRNITAHRLVSRSGDTVVTENSYRYRPRVTFRWRTTLRPSDHRLDFILLNPEACGQRFHYGHIQLEAVKESTRVTQVAYFDFWGATLWVLYPWRGGMPNILTDTAHWEQKMVEQLRDHYGQDPHQKADP